MTSRRATAFPLEHLGAELFAFPFASVAALDFGLTCLDPDMHDVSGATATVWRATEVELLRSFPSVSVDEISNLRDGLWFGGARMREISLGNVLRRGADIWLGHREGYPTPEFRRDVDKRPAHTRNMEARWFWRWLSLAMPSDIVLAACPIPGTHVAAVSATLARELDDQGYAQIHLHLGAAQRFEDYWVGVLHAIASTSSEAYASPGAVFGDGRGLGPAILRAALSRQVVGAFLTNRRPQEGVVNFVNKRVWRWWPEAFWPLRKAMEELLTGSRTLNYAELQSTYAAITGVTTARPPRNADEIQSRDPLVLAGFVPGSWDSNCTPEVRLVQSALRYMDASAGEDVAFERIFWQMVRVRCLLYRHVVQRPLTPGLQWFSRFYDRLKPGRPSGWSDSLRIDAAVALDRPERGLRSLEFRTAPDCATKTLELVRATELVRNGLVGVGEEADRSAEEERGRGLERARDPAPPLSYRGRPVSGGAVELGAVLHFPKSRGANSSKGLFPARWAGSHADPRVIDEDSPNSSGYRYQRYYVGQRQAAYGVGRALLDFPLALAVLRGIDMCTDEQGVPTWVMQPLFRYLREAGAIASGWLRNIHGVEVRGLRTTAHVGEDFVHLLGGLRRVDEAVHYLSMGEGDRLGHALALGIDPESWAIRTGMVALPVEERWLDLAWEWSSYAHRHTECVSAQRSDYVEAELESLSARLFGDRHHLAAGQIARVIEALYDESRLQRAGFPMGPPIGRNPDPIDSCLVRLLTDPDVFERGREIIIVDTAREGSALKELQNALRRRVGRIGIAVEVNPSSNLLIGDLTDLREHPIWRLDPPVGSSDVPPLSVCIGSDDPLTFATTLRQEYQLLADSLVMAGLSKEEARRWVNRVRECSLRMRFTLPLSQRVRIRDIQGPPPKEPEMMP